MKRKPKVRASDLKYGMTVASVLGGARLIVDGTGGGYGTPAVLLVDTSVWRCKHSCRDFADLAELVNAGAYSIV